MIPPGELIWVAVQPILRLLLTVSCGFAVSKAGLFPPVAARGAGQVLLNVTLPSLMFSRIVPAFNSSTVGAIGPLLFIALLYEGIGIVISWIITQVFWVPHRFRHGILVAGGWGNVGDIPTSVVMSITAAAPFNGTADQNLAIAYLSVFTLVFFVTLFPLGGTKWLEMDFEGPEVLDAEVQERLKAKQRRMGTTLERSIVKLMGPLYRRRSSSTEIEKDDDEKVAIPTEAEELAKAPIPSLISRPVSAHSTIVQHEPVTAMLPDAKHERSGPVTPVALRHRIARHAVTFIRLLITPSSLAIILSFVISVVPVLKALFVPDVPGVHMASTPDGQPPLAIILNTATFIGAASVPIGLMILGAALSRLEVPDGRLRSLPLGAIGALAIGRMVIMPVLGVLICQGLTHIHVLDANNHVLRFVAIFLSCLPTATSQVYLTQVYSGTGSAEHLSVFLIPQYILMFITMTALTAYTLALLFG